MNTKTAREIAPEYISERSEHFEKIVTIIEKLMEVTSTTGYSFQNSVLAAVRIAKGNDSSSVVVSRWRDAQDEMVGAMLWQSVHENSTLHEVASQYNVNPTLGQSTALAKLSNDDWSTPGLTTVD